MATNGFISSPIKSLTRLVDPSPNNDMLQRFLAAFSNRGAAPASNAPDLLGVIKEMRKSKDVVGERNLNSGPGGSSSPFNTGFFKPMDMAFPELGEGYKPENLDDINNRLFPGMAPAERAQAYQVGAPKPAESVRWHPNDQSLGLVPGSEDRVGPNGMSTGRELYSPYAPGGVKGSSTFETPQKPIGFRELGTNPSPEVIQAILADPQFGQPQAVPQGSPGQQPQLAAQPSQPQPQLGSAPVPQPVTSPLGVPQPGGGMQGLAQVPAGVYELSQMLNRLLGGR